MDCGYLVSREIGCWFDQLRAVKHAVTLAETTDVDGEDGEIFFVIYKPVMVVKLSQKITTDNVTDLKPPDEIPF